jgi:hypothetical protein
VHVLYFVDYKNTTLSLFIVAITILSLAKYKTKTLASFNDCLPTESTKRPFTEKVCADTIEIEKKKIKKKYNLCMIDFYKMIFVKLMALLHEYIFSNS